MPDASRHHRPSDAPLRLVVRVIRIREGEGSQYECQAGDLARRADVVVRHPFDELGDHTPLGLALGDHPRGVDLEHGPADVRRPGQRGAQPARVSVLPGELLVIGGTSEHEFAETPHVNHLRRRRRAHTTRATRSWPCPDREPWSAETVRFTSSPSTPSTFLAPPEQSCVTRPPRGSVVLATIVATPRTCPP